MINFGQCANIWLNTYQVDPGNPPQDQNALLQDNGFFLTQDNGSLILLEG